MTLRCILAFLFFSPFLLAAQEEDPVLFTVEGRPVHVSEFQYIYEKTSSEEAAYTKASLEEYLDLYIRFKVKVQRALELGLDTEASLNQELEGYRQNLADNYLVDRATLDLLIQEAWDRKQQDVDISHVLIAASPLAAPEDSLAAYTLALQARERLENGESFSTVAREMSSDNSAQANGGHIGFVTALFPNGYYPLETAAYTQPLDVFSQPVRTSAGYHILQVHARRPARGTRSLAHIMVRSDETKPSAAKTKADSLYLLLQQGTNFEELGRKESEDGSTRGDGGLIGEVGINRFEAGFEDAAFALETPGQISSPVQTSLGWHIIKLVSLPEIQPFASEKYRLESEIRKDSRLGVARDAVVAELKAEEGFSEQPKTLQTILDTISDSFFNPEWIINSGLETPLFTLGDSSIYLKDFNEFIRINSRQRQALRGRAAPAHSLDYIYEAYKNQTCLNYLDVRLEQIYPEFGYLMREYREGILLFEATQREVWQVSSQDTAGLKMFYEQNKGDYRWKPRARMSRFFLSSSAKEKIDEVRGYAQGHERREVLEYFNTGDQSILAATESMYEQGVGQSPFGAADLKTGELSPNSVASPNETISFYKIEEMLPPSPKSLEDAKGYVTADYQDYLQEKWVEDLIKKYEVKVNEDVFRELIAD